jgi:hypothetical protein
MFHYGKRDLKAYSKDDWNQTTTKNVMVRYIGGVTRSRPSTHLLERYSTYTIIDHAVSRLGTEHPDYPPSLDDLSTCCVLAALIHDPTLRHPRFSLTLHPEFQSSTLDASRHQLQSRSLLIIATQPHTASHG